MSTHKSFDRDEINHEIMKSESNTDSLTGIDFVDFSLFIYK